MKDLPKGLKGPVHDSGKRDARHEASDDHATTRKPELKQAPKPANTGGTPARGKTKPAPPTR